MLECIERFVFTLCKFSILTIVDFDFLMFHFLVCSTPFLTLHYHRIVLSLPTIFDVFHDNDDNRIAFGILSGICPPDHAPKQSRRRIP